MKPVEDLPMCTFVLLVFSDKRVRTYINSNGQYLTVILNVIGYLVL